MLKVIAFAYWQLCRFFSADEDDKSASWKALTVVCIAEYLVIWSVFASTFVVIGHAPFRFSPTWNAIILWPACALLAALNGRLLRSRGDPGRWEREFGHASPQRKAVGRLSVLLALLLIVGVALWAKAGWNRLYQ